MYEDIRTAAIRLDEAEPLLIIEKLHCTRVHVSSFQTGLNKDTRRKLCACPIVDRLERVSDARLAMPSMTARGPAKGSIAISYAVPRSLARQIAPSSSFSPTAISRKSRDSTKLALVIATFAHHIRLIGS
jgi:hypothetical protein